MYLQTTKRKNKNGTVTEYLQLAHNVRDPETNSTVARIIHSFGRADQLDRDALVRLARSIARRCGRGKLDTPFSRASATRKTLPPCFLFPIHAFIAASSLSRPFFAHNPMNDKNTHVRQIRVLR